MTGGRECDGCGEEVRAGAMVGPTDDPSNKVFLCGKCLPDYVTPDGEPLMTEEQKDDQKAIAHILKVAAEGYVNGFNACMQIIEERKRMDIDDLLRFLRKEIDNAKVEDMVELKPEGPEGELH